MNIQAQESQSRCSVPLIFVVFLMVIGRSTLTYTDKKKEKSYYHAASCAGQPAGCHCPVCSAEWAPVCGGNGRVYDNVCQLERDACLTNTNILLVPLNLCGTVVKA
jgi:hypothetical protein